MKLPIKRPSRDVYSWDPFDEIRRMQEYMEQMRRAFPALENRYVSETLSPRDRCRGRRQQSNCYNRPSWH